MVESMTGYGKSSGSFEGKKVSIEIRSLNSKSLDINLRMANSYKELEPPIRSLIAEKLDRGKIDVLVSVDSMGEQKNVAINRELAKAYYAELRSVNHLIEETTTDYLSLILRMPDIYVNERDELSENEKTWLLSLVTEACDSAHAFRRQEGLELEREFKLRISQISQCLDQIPRYEGERIQQLRERIKRSLDELGSVNHDDNRFEQEMIFYLEKLDISEEKMRLANHLSYFLETMRQPRCGKKLGFIGQEIGREINTLGSKSNHMDMQKLVVDMKDGLEKIKEQVLNTL